MLFDDSVHIEARELALAASYAIRRAARPAVRRLGDEGDTDSLSRGRRSRAHRSRMLIDMNASRVRHQVVLHVRLGQAGGDHLRELQAGTQGSLLGLRLRAVQERQAL